MYVEWTEHLHTPEEKERFERRIYNSREVLDRIKAILEKKEAALDRSETSIKTYDSANWENRQAHKNGNREAFDFLKKLVDLDHQRVPGELQ